jgi:hypothetical protein
MRVDSNKFHCARLEVDTLAKKSLRDEVTGRVATSLTEPAPAGDHQRLQPTARTAVFGTALDRPDPFTYVGTGTVDGIPAYRKL